MKRLALGTALALVLVAAIAISAHALDRNTRPVGPVQLWEAGKMAGFSDAWLQVKFVERSEVRLEDGRFVDPSGLDLERLNEVVQREAVRIMRPMLSHDRSLLRSWKDAGERRAGVVGPDLSLWFDIHIDGGAAAVARLVNSLNELPCVEIAHPAPIPQSLTMTGSRVVVADREVSATGAAARSHDQRMAGDRTPDFSDLQGYLYDPPIGFGAPAAWAYPGGLGAGERVIDLELFAGPARHEDFDPAKLFYEDGVSPNYSNHELAALGQVIGAHNGFGIRGFAPEALYGVQNFDVDTMGEYLPAGDRSARLR
ncbi:MAG: hypothetical protein QUU85_10615 [Candidatus Eisenbacteria bacterium]|nr:hypothetical protein [Candidatus Eisenbacteria bacterium]